MNQGVLNHIMYPHSLQSSVGAAVGVTQALSTITTYVAFKFPKHGNGYLTGFYFYASAITGIAALVSMTVELQADLAGVPSGVALDTCNMPAGSFSAGAGQYKAVFTGNYSLSDSAQYWLVLKPIASHYLTLRWATNGLQNTTNRKITTDGTTWGTIAAACGFVFEFSGNILAGFPFTNAMSNPLNIYSSRIGGMKLSNIQENVSIAGVYAFLSKSGTPPNPMVVDIYVNGLLIGTTGGVTAGDLTSTFNLPLFLSRPIQAKRGDTIIAAFRTTGGDGSNYYRFNSWITPIETSPIIYHKDLCMSYSTTSGSIGSWSDTANTLPMVALLLDFDHPFLPTPLNRRKFNNQR